MRPLAGVTEAGRRTASGRDEGADVTEAENGGAEGAKGGVAEDGWGGGRWGRPVAVAGRRTAVAAGHRLISASM